MKRYTGCTVSVMIVLAMLVHTTAAKEYKVSIVVPYYGHLLYTVALEQGFFVEEGVTVTPTYYWAESDYVSAMIHGKVDLDTPFNSLHIDMLTSGFQKVSLGVFGYEEKNFCWIAKRDVIPQNFSEYKLGVDSIHFGHKWSLWEYLQRYHINISDLHFVTDIDNKDILSNFIAGRLPVVLLVGVYVDMAIQQGNGVIIAESSPRQTLNSITMTKENYDAVARDDLKCIMRALIKAIAWIAHQASEEELFGMIKRQWSHNPQFASSRTIEDFRRVKKSITFIPPEQLYTMNTTYLKETYDMAKTVLHNMGHLNDFLVYDEIVDTGILLEVLEELGFGATP